MRTIVIRPEIVGYHNLCFPEPARPLNRPALACAVLLPLVAFAGWAGGRYSVDPRPVPTAPRAAVVVNSVPFKITVPEAPLSPTTATPDALDGAIELQAALDQSLVKAEFDGNGRDLMTAKLSNTGSTPVLVKVSFGQVLECGRNGVVVTHTARKELAAGRCDAMQLSVASLRSTNRLRPGSYRLSAKAAPKLDLLLAYAQDHAELTAPALQTAVLAITENLPLNALCKFTVAGSDLPSHFDTSPFRAETVDLLLALTAMRSIGLRERDFALTVDPQLKIEAMLEPASRGAAMRYYDITEAKEWDFWKNELLNGELATRHYALFGIARFYPDIAVDMLPTWAREKRTTHSFRVAAVQALAETQRPAALAVLQRLVDELGRNTELGRAALEASHYLTGRLGTGTVAELSVAFRSSTLHPF